MDVVLSPSLMQTESFHNYLDHYICMYLCKQRFIKSQDCLAEKNYLIIYSKYIQTDKIFQPNPSARLADNLQYSYRNIFKETQQQILINIRQLRWLSPATTKYINLPEQTFGIKYLFSERK